MLQEDEEDVASIMESGNHIEFLEHLLALVEAMVVLLTMLPWRIGLVIMPSTMPLAIMTLTSPTIRVSILKTKHSPCIRYWTCIFTYYPISPKWPLMER